MLVILCIPYDALSITKAEAITVVVIRASQKVFTEDEVSRLTGLCLDTLRQIARNKHLGVLRRVAEAAGQKAEQLFFSHADLMVLNLLTQEQRSDAKD